MGVLLIAIAWVPSRGMQFDRSVENMFGTDHPVLKPYRLLNRAFGDEEIILAVSVDPDLLTKEGIGRVAALTEQIGRVPGVVAVSSVTTTPLRDEILEDNELGPKIIGLMEGYLVGADHQTVAVAAMLDPRADSEARGETLSQIERIARSQTAKTVLVGGPIMLAEAYDLVDADGLFLGWVSTALLMLAILASFRSLRWVIVPVIIVNMTIVLTKALLVVLGFQMSIVSSMMWSTLTVIGIATAMHVIVHFRAARSSGLSPIGAMETTATRLAIPILWTCMTSAAGFAALNYAEVGPIRDFGTMMIFASLLLLVPLILIVPGLVLAGRFDVDPHCAWGEAAMHQALDAVLSTVLKRPRTIAIACTLSVAGVVLGTSRLEVETDFTRNFRESNPIVTSYSVVEDRLGGAGVWDIIVPAPPLRKLNERYVQRVRELQRRLHEEVGQVSTPHGSEDGLTKVFSLVDLLDTFPAEKPILGAIFLRVRYNRLKRKMPQLVSALYGQDPDQPERYFARIMLRSKERLPAAQKRQIINRVSMISREIFPETQDDPPAEVTGFYVLLASMIEGMVHDQWITFGISTLAVGLMMWLAFRSPVLALVALVPNVLPILMIMGTVGWLDIKINMGAAMIAAVSMGLSIDSEIHYVTAFQRERARGQTTKEALFLVQQSVGQAVVFSTVALVLGFGSLCFSEFVPTVYFGALLSVSMLGSLFGNLVILPLLLQLVVKDNPVTTNC